MDSVFELSELSLGNIVALTAASIVLLGISIVWPWKRPQVETKRLPDIPMFGSEEDESSRLAVEEGYQKVVLNHIACYSVNVH